MLRTSQKTRLRLAAWFGLFVGVVGCDRQSKVTPPVSAPFLDVTDEVRLDFQYDPGSTGRRYFCEIMGAGAALFDYDGDGDLDLYLTQGGQLDPSAEVVTDRLFRNDAVEASPGFRWVDVTTESGIRAFGYGMGVSTGDIDNDGDVDVYVTNFGPNQLFANNGDGTFSDITESAGVAGNRWSASAAFLDYDRDGRLDLFVTNYVDFELGNHKECFDPGGFPDYCAPGAYNPVPDRLYRNLGSGRFEDVSARSGIASSYGPGLGVVTTDANSDGWIDLFVANDQGANLLWLNQRDGTFENSAMIAGCALNADGQVEASMGIDAGDFDGDQDEDLFVSHLSTETNTLYQNEGTSVYSDRTDALHLGLTSLRYTGFGTGWVDYDNDGWLDLFVGNGSVAAKQGVERSDQQQLYGQSNQLFHNEIGSGNHELRDVSSECAAALAPQRVTRGVAFGDLDGDGDSDIVVCNLWGPTRTLLNQVGQHANWVGLRLVSDGRDALGARVQLHLRNGKTIDRRVRTDGSYLSARDPRLMFGLGEAAAVDGVRVSWPDGSIETFAPPPLNRWSTLTAGNGKAAQ